MHRVLIQHAILPPYRLPVFQALCASEKIEVTVGYGEAAPGSTLISMEAPERVRAVRVANRFFGPGPAITLQRGLIEAFDKGGFDTLIVSFDPRILSNRKLIAHARRKGARVLLWGHGIRPSGRFANIYRKMANDADALLLYTGEGKRKLVDVGVNPEKMFVAWNSIDTVTIAKLRSSTPLSSRHGILYLGRMIPEKKASLLVRGFAKALDGLGPDARLYLIGKGPDRDVAIGVANELGISDRVEFVPETYEEAQIAEYMNRCWVSVSPGYVGLSAIHAFAYGLPMLAGDPEPHSPEVEALEVGKNGRFFRADDADDLAAGLLALRSNAPALDEMGRHAVATGDRFSVQAMVEAFESAVAYAHDKAAPSR